MKSERNSTSGEKARRRMAHYDPWRMEPGFQTFYDIGVRVQKQMPKRMTLRAMGRELGMTHQNVYTETVVALGKFCYALREIRRREMAV